MRKCGSESICGKPLPETGWTADHTTGVVLAGHAESTLASLINTGRDDCKPIESSFYYVFASMNREADGVHDRRYISSVRRPGE
jgi:hypothetical protein